MINNVHIDIFRFATVILFVNESHSYDQEQICALISLSYRVLGLTTAARQTNYTKGFHKLFLFPLQAHRTLFVTCSVTINIVISE